VSAVARRYEFDDRFFERTDDPEVAYFAGLVVADGCVIHTPESTVLDVTLHQSDSHHLRKFADALKIPSGFSPVYRARGCSKLIVSSPNLRVGLTMWGAIPRKTYELREMPKLWSNPNTLPHFVRGLWDGDGHIGHHHTKNTTHIGLNITCNSWIIDWLADVMNERGTPFNRYNSPPRMIEDGSPFVVSKLCICRHGAILDWLEWLGYYDSGRPTLDRKRGAAMEIRDWCNRTIRRNHQPKVWAPRPCVHCGIYYTPESSNGHRQKYCSPKCGMDHRNQMRARFTSSATMTVTGTRTDTALPFES